MVKGARARSNLTAVAPLFRGVIAAGRIVSLGVVLSLLSAVSVAYVVHSRTHADFERRAEDASVQIERSFRAPLEALHAVDALERTFPNLDTPTFSQFAKPLIARHPSLAALEWVVRIRDADRAAFEATVSERRGRPFQIREPDAAGRMVVSPQHASYAVLVHAEPISDDLDGFNTSFDAPRGRFLEEAVTRRAMFASSRIRLVEDPPTVHSVIVYLPQFADDARLVGVAIALFRIEPLMRAAIARGAAGQEVIDFALVDVDEQIAPPERLLFVTRPGADAPDARSMLFSKEVYFGGKRWKILASEIPRRDLAVPSAVFAVGLLMTALVAIAVSSARRVARLERDNRELRSLGQYTLVRKLGEGGMGEVYEAKHRLLRRRAAVKVIRRQRASPAVIERFQREAQITSELTHPNTIIVYDYGLTTKGEFYYVMEYVEGLSLREVVSTVGPLRPAHVRYLLLQVCGALAEAHDRGFVHRDVKPSNLMVCRRGGRDDFVKVLDFGLVSDVGVDPRRASTVGTPRYMAPEAFVAPESVGPTADIYAIGCVAFFLLTGRDVFGEDDEVALATAHLTRQPPPLSTEERPLPEELEKVVYRCLEKSPDDRYRSMHQVIVALTRLDLGEWTALDGATWWAALKQRRESVPRQAGSARTLELEI